MPRPACSFRSAQAATLLNFMYHSRIVLSISGSVWYVVRNHGCTVKIDSVLANSNIQNAFLFPLHAMFRQDCPPSGETCKYAKWPSTQKFFRNSLPIDMLLFGVTTPATVPQRSEISEGLMNYVVLLTSRHGMTSCHPQLTSVL
jgi:hypothetical protein